MTKDAPSGSYIGNYKGFRCSVLGTMDKDQLYASYYKSQCPRPSLKDWMHSVVDHSLFLITVNVPEPGHPSRVTGHQVPHEGFPLLAIGFAGVLCLEFAFDLGHLPPAALTWQRRKVQRALRLGEGLGGGQQEGQRKGADCSGTGAWACGRNLGVEGVM